MDFGERHFTVFTIGFLVFGFALGFFSYAFFVDKKFHTLPVFVKEQTEKVGNASDIEQTQTATGERTLRERSLGLNLPMSQQVLGKNVIVVAPQAAGNTVVISLASLSANGWIAIRDDIGTGQLGAILGARRFVAGDYFGESIELLRETEGGRTYFAVLHQDDGDEMFEHTSEVPYVNASGDIIKEQFFVTMDVSE